ncbi:hypothetical protein ACIQU4_41840 [Streptomyces sp. NPDC090741]|uniref:hypothetical protein n=1 Tax=Streptomyces sp. NPDC090741 TaxID=3365967 RepID=UPI00381325DA
MRTTTSIPLVTTITFSLAFGAAGTAVADDPPVPLIAPYTQAAAEVDAAGTLLKAKNVDEVSRPFTGVYCVHVSDPRINLARSAPTGTLQGFPARGGSIRVEVEPSTGCGEEENTLTVLISNAAGSPANAQFYVTIQ